MAALRDVTWRRAIQLDPAFNAAGNVPRPCCRPCYRRRLAGPGGRGGTGRRARFRSWYRKMWGFESLRPHQLVRPTTHAARSLTFEGLNPIMQTVETLNEGLKRAYRITIPAKDIDARVDDELKKIAPQVRMPGFRPGKVPANLVRKMHGAALEQQALQNAVQDGVQQLLDRAEAPPGDAARGRARGRRRRARTPWSRSSSRRCPTSPRRRSRV